MSQEPVEVTPPSTPGQEQPQDQETDSLAHTAESMTALPTQPEGFPQHQKNWRQRLCRWVSGPSVWVFIALVILATVYICSIIFPGSLRGDVDSRFTFAPGGVCSSDTKSQNALSD